MSVQDLAMCEQAEQTIVFSLISIYVLLFPGALLVSVQDLAMSNQAQYKH